MKSLLVYYDPDLTTQQEDIPIPDFGNDEVLIKVVVAGSNPKDWKHPMPTYFNVKVNQGDDVAGIVEAVGSNVRHFRKGDRVAGFHEMDVPRGTYAEYTVCFESTVFHIPDFMDFEEAATIPLTAFTASLGLYRDLDLPLPIGRSDENSAQEKIPLVINGASGAVGAFAVKLAKLNPRISPIIGIAGGSADFAKEIGCDIVVDYRCPNVTQELRKVLDGRKCSHVFDTNNSLASVQYLKSILEPGSRYTCVQGGPDFDAQVQALDESRIWHERIWVGSVHEDKLPGARMFGAAMSRIFEWAMLERRLVGHPYEVVDGGLGGVLGALTRLRDRKSGNAKYVFRIADTPDLSE